MKEINDRIFDKIVILVWVYPVAVFLAFLFILFKSWKRIRIIHPERFPYGQGNVILLANHPELDETIILPIMLYRNYLLHPFKLRSWSTPDKKNYYDRWYWYWLLRYVAVPIDRSNKRERSNSFRRLAKILISGGVEVFFGEGGRTRKGTDFFYSLSGKNKIRPLQKGVALLIRRTGALVVPIWVQYKERALNLPDKVYFVSLIFVLFLTLWKKEAITIKIGKPLRFQRSDSREEITQKLVTTLLELADEPC